MKLTLTSHLRVAFLLVLAGCAPVITKPPEPCDCALYAYEALKRAHIKLATLPAIVGTNGPNSYYRGVARIHFPQPCMVYVHEFVHHDQWLRGLEAEHTGDARWWALEQNAQVVTERVIDEVGQCN